jgi:hypothetical protein
LSTEEATVIRHLSLMPTAAPVEGPAPQHEHETCSEVWRMVYAFNTHRVTGRICKQRCRCGATRDVVWPPSTPGCKPIGFGEWR